MLLQDVLDVFGERAIIGSRKGFKVRLQLRVNAVAQNVAEQDMPWSPALINRRARKLAEQARVGGERLAERQPVVRRRRVPRRAVWLPIRDRQPLDGNLHCVYLFGMSGVNFVKLGYTANLGRRRRGLRFPASNAFCPDGCHRGDFIFWAALPTEREARAAEMIAQEFLSPHQVGYGKSSNVGGKRQWFEIAPEKAIALVRDVLAVLSDQRVRQLATHMDVALDFGKCLTGVGEPCY